MNYKKFTTQNKQDLLKMLEEGKSQRNIAKTLDFAPSLISYHIKKMLKNDLIREIRSTRYFGPQQKLYSLTNKGKSQIGSEFKFSSPGGEKNGQEFESRPRWLMHHAQFKYPILKDAPIQMSIQVHMNNWTKQIDEWKYCKAVKSDSSIIFHIKNLYGNDPHELELRSRKIADRMASIYEDNWGMELGRPQQLGTPHWKIRLH
jgi:DNA-binding MarR family transcriptional regulator